MQGISTTFAMASLALLLVTAGYRLSQLLA